MLKQEVFNFFGILDPFDECMAFFFFGCLLARLLSNDTPVFGLLIKYGLLAIVLAGIVRIVHHYYPFLPQKYVTMLFDVPLIPVASCAVLTVILMFRNLKSKRMIKGFRSVGNMTYSLYLVHFPIQMAIVLILDPADPSIYNEPSTLFVFLALSILAGWLVYEYFERPVQIYLRNKFGEGRPAVKLVPEIKNA